MFDERGNVEYTKGAGYHDFSRGQNFERYYFLLLEYP